ncbi:soluble scavenger receptor cysteine-rich domain-containing protein SSC5D isoform X2 [Heterocephalus glaber]|uniref:Soluble scavenger receptor cysteine-rich domain-containing protein SSC5D n=1 Tax=Heterocephalus glaber TaxID=10181 RepID=A0AAX6S031_HETGA|nr:soluble scavenger receptor cysteine-rich domain-containing protein SSC5D isoform X2 [Heterocephalus glaber]
MGGGWPSPGCCPIVSGSGCWLQTAGRRPSQWVPPPTLAAGPSPPVPCASAASLPPGQAWPCLLLGTGAVLGAASLLATGPNPLPFTPALPDSAPMRVLACLLALVGIQAVDRLRLADGPHGCAGRLEVWYGSRWGTVCDDGWDLQDAAVACRELGCGGALAAPGGAFFGEGTGPVWLSELACQGLEERLGLCPHRGWKAHICSHEEDAGVVCTGQRAADSQHDSTSPLDGEPRPGSEEPPVTHAPRPAGSPQNGPRKKSPRPPKQAKSTRAPLLTTGAPRQDRLRLVSGPHSCAGRLEVWHGGRWGSVCDDGWDLQDAAVACRELGCGGALAAPGGARFGPGSGPVWMDDVGCAGAEQALRDCPRSPWGRSNCDHREDAGLVCTGPAPRLRLADGPHGCAGRLEVWHGGRWGSVCDDAWDLQDAAVACRELGCGGALAAPGAAFFGEGSGPIVLDDLRCRGNETALRFCPARPWGQHDCHHREDAGAVCDGMPLGYATPTRPVVDSNSSGPGTSAPGAWTLGPLSSTVSQAPRMPGSLPPAASPTAPQEPGPDAGSPQLRLVAGPSRCSGRLEVWHDGRWGTVCDDSWDLRDSAVVCRELGCRGPRQPDPAVGRFGWGAGPIWLDDVGCVGTEASLSDCPAAPWGKHNCAHNEDVGVMCTGTPGLDTISDPFSWSWLPGLGRDRDAWLPGELATKPSASLTSIVPEKTTTKAPRKTPKSTKKWVTKHAKRPTAQPPRMPTTKHSRGLGTQSPPELTSQTTTLTTEASSKQTSELLKRLLTEAPHRWTSHTTSKPTPQAPWTWPSGTMTTLSPQGPQEMTSETTIEKIRQASLEPSAETPAFSPTASIPGEPGPFRVRLADGPNRCAGRLEVWHAGRWGTVCDDSWDLRDATVVCWELGCGKVRPRVGKTHYGPGTGPIWLDDMGCKGSETSLSDCPSGGWGKHNCDHEEDVGFTCTGYTDDDDYPPWTWDPTSGEDLAKGATMAPGPGRALPWSSTRHPAISSPATRLLSVTGDQEGYKPSGTWDTPWGRGSAKRTPTTAPTLSSGTSRPPGHPSLAPRAHGDTGSPQRAGPERRLLRPTAARAAPQTRPPAPSALPGPRGLQPTSGPASVLPGTSVAGPDLPSSTTPDLSPAPTPPPTAPRELTSDPSVPPEGTPGPNTAPYWGTAVGTSGSPEPSTSPHPTATTYSPTTPYPTITPNPTTTANPTTSPHYTTTLQPMATPLPASTLPTTTIPLPATTPHPTATPHPATTTRPARTADPSSTPMVTTKSLPTSLGPESPSSTTVPRATSSLGPQVTFEGTPHTPTSQMQSPVPSPASEASPSRAPLTSSRGPLSTEDFRPPRSQNPTLTPGPASEPILPSDPHSDQLPHDHPPLGPTPGQTLGPLGPCACPAAPVRVRACEPPALVELVAAVRDVGGQLQRLATVLEQDWQERQALGLGLAQLGLGQLGETVRRLAEVAWAPSTPVSTSTTPEEEERPLRGDV